MIAGPTVMCAVSQVKNLHIGNRSCSWPDSSLACAITSTGKTQILYSSSATLDAQKALTPIHCHFPRVVYVFGSHVKEPPSDITPTFLTTGVLSTLRQADFVAHSILRESGECSLPYT